LNILDFDTKIFRFINNGMSNSFFDAIMPFLRESSIWIPVYLFILLLVWQHWGIKTVYWLSIATLTILISDTVSSSWIKNWVGRVRPCNEISFQSWIHVLVQYRPRSGSFTSSHATNHFAFASFCVLSTKQFLGKWINALYVWAAVICFAQVYVGVHYPGDILGGCLLGLLIGKLTNFLFNKMMQRLETTYPTASTAPPPTDQPAL
jgi:membrane-associated phospholipid phosphatase